MLVEAEGTVEIAAAQIEGLAHQKLAKLIFGDAARLPGVGCGRWLGRCGGGWRRGLRRGWCLRRFRGLSGLCVGCCAGAVQLKEHARTARIAAAEPEPRSRYVAFIGEPLSATLTGTPPPLEVEIGRLRDPSVG